MLNPIQNPNTTIIMILPLKTSKLLQLLSFLLAATAPPFGAVSAQEEELYDFAMDLGGIPNDASAAASNAAALQFALNNNATNATLRFDANQTFYFHHGIVATNLQNARLEIDGTWRFVRSDIPADAFPHPFPACIAVVDSRNVTLTTSSISGPRGVIDGQGSQWWGIPLIGYLQVVENRPRLLRFNTTQDLLIERLVLQDSPYHGLYLDNVNRVQVRYVSIVARRTTQDGHSWIDLTAFNTDGIDVSGTNVWVHDVDIWTQDDCIAVKDVNHDTDLNGGPPQTANMTFERINATGLGFVIGSILGTRVHNITFRNSYLYKPVKGIYLKTAKRVDFFRDRNRTALIENVLYQNITMVSPMQWPIWIGPAQQADNRNPCHPNPCSLCWPMTPGSKCNVVPRQVVRNVTLQNVGIYNPRMATGVLMGNAANPLTNIVFDNVRVTMAGLPPAITRRPLTETFAGLKRPVHDPYVPPAYANKVQRQLVGFTGWIVNLVTTIGRFVTTLVERIHLALILRLLQTQDGAQAWYLSYLGQALLNTVWVWIVCAVGFAVAGVFSFRGWMRYRRRLKEQIATRREQQMGTSNAEEEEEEEQQQQQQQEQENENGNENNRVEGDNDGYHAIEENVNVNDAERIERASMMEELLLRHPRVETRWPPFLCHLGYFTLLCICWGGALYTGTFPFRKPKWERTYRYFACESVVNGVARGNTWPMPFCFKNERPPWWHGGGGDSDDPTPPPPPHHHHRRRHGSDHWSPHKVEISTERFLLTAGVALVVLAIAMWKHWTEQRQRQNGEEREEDEVDPSLPVPSFVTIDASHGDEKEPLWPQQEHQRDAGSGDEERYVDPLAAPSSPGPH